MLFVATCSCMCVGDVYKGVYRLRTGNVVITRQCYSVYAPSLHVIGQLLCTYVHVLVVVGGITHSGWDQLCCLRMFENFELFEKKNTETTKKTKMD